MGKEGRKEGRKKICLNIKVNYSPNTFASSPCLSLTFFETTRASGFPPSGKAECCGLRCVNGRVCRYGNIVISLGGVKQ